MEHEINISEASHEDSIQGNTSIGDTEVATTSVVDYTNAFKTDEVFKSKNDLLDWTRTQGKKNNMVIVIKRSDAGGVDRRRKRARITFACERHGKYRSILRKSDINDQNSDANNKKKKEPRNTGTKKCGCPFMLQGVNVGEGDEWKLEVECGVHNHTYSQYLEGHSFVGRLTKEQNELLVDMSTSLVRPKVILNTIKKKDPLNVTTMRTIYNARHYHRTKEKAGRSEMQQLLCKLAEYNYIEHHRSIGVDNVVSDLFWTHPINVDILHCFPHVLIMDCTYKTNRHRFPLLEIVGVTSTNITFSVAFAFIDHEKEDNYTWALTRLKTLMNDDCIPGVIVTDRDLALMNAIRNVFPSTRHLLCRWHINQAVATNCKKLFTLEEVWNMFFNDWQTLVSSSTEEEYLHNWHAFESKFSSFHEGIDYLKTTWLNEHKEKFVAAWTDTCMHFGTKTSNRAESAHSKLKRMISSSQLSFDILWNNIHALLELQHTELKASFEKSRCFVYHGLKHEELRELRGFVSIEALNIIVCEAKRIDSVGDDVVSCGCTLRCTHQLPCAHEIAKYRSSSQPIPIDCIHPRWRKLDMIIEPSAFSPPILPIRALIERFVNWFEGQTNESRRQLCIKIEELMNPSSTTLTEPVKKIKTKGRPRKVDTSTRRLPSAFEIAEALSGHDSQPQPSKKKPRGRPRKLKTYSSILHNPATPTHQYTGQFPEAIKQYITIAIDVLGDGNCGYRVIAEAMGFGQDSWPRIHMHRNSTG
ncbi:PKS-NRPS hybrid synthetase cheA-like [Malus domestica]|uniref:PKS-NRPS hybrid synthetase cheA-like n=1 Tax=Malus domestica TaxID=3750 RepID=UPI003976CAD5